MPRLWVDTIEAHKRSVRDAITDTAAALVDEYGLRAVTMAQIAEASGIGRATLYKYFPDVEAMLLAWHERQVTHHLELLVEAGDRAADPRLRLESVLRELARHRGSRRGGHHPELAALLHQDHHLVHAEKRLAAFLRDLIADAAAAGEVREDVPPTELARYCLHALGAASSVASKAAVDRLVTVTLGGLRRAD